ncbi:hypothetical protein HanPSC8_Chr09g0369631 [Helianthus annuus]|nr:hypothetical protein HanPSC8_Chr09g0369631 [Helianthus annuus]
MSSPTIVFLMLVVEVSSILDEGRCLDLEASRDGPEGKKASKQTDGCVYLFVA